MFQCPAPKGLGFLRGLYAYSFSVKADKKGLLTIIKVQPLSELIVGRTTKTDGKFPIAYHGVRNVTVINSQRFRIEDFQRAII